ncbi:MAG: putative DNA binding domain-containing protein [Oscillospiraceae bacterium]|nr:putative DNA binding domain-containing protein [Oscillospiraceae bacterium]
MKSYEPQKSIEQLLNAAEGEHYQFKEAKNRYDFTNAVKICCALANCGGGKLVLGVSDKRPRKVVGSTAFPQPERTCADLMDKLRIRIAFHVYEHNDGRVLVFDVASRPIGLPVQTDSGAWWYQGDSLILMPENIRRTIYAESGHDFSGDICPGATIDDLDNKAIEVFRKEWGRSSGNSRIAKLKTEQMLRDCDVVTDNGITYAALILFGKRSALVKYLPHAEIIFEYRSSERAGPAAQREDFSEGFFNCYNRIWELINLRNDKQYYQDKLQVLSVPTFNERVVREALLNAVSHRDYQLGGSIFVRQYQSKLVIENPGGFPHGITVENILDRQSARNTRIARVFQLCGFVERSGQGMNLIYELAIKEAKPLPNFSGSDAYFVKLTLEGKVFNEHMLALIKKTDEELLDSMTTDDYVLLSALYQGENLSDYKQSQFEHLVELGIITHTELDKKQAENGRKQSETGSKSAENKQKTSSKQAENGSKSAENVRKQAESKQKTSSKQAETEQNQSVMNKNKRLIINYLDEREQISATKAAKLINLSDSRARAVLKEMTDDDLIEKMGKYRGAYYVLK